MKTIKVKVTQDHINKGIKEDCIYCPIALALIEQGYKEVRVTTISARFDSPDSPNGDSQIRYRLPQEAKDFILYFDSELPVKPFEFELSE